MTQEQWYSNKDLYEMFVGLRDEMSALRVDLRETQQLVKQYNGLRQQIHALEARLLAIEQQRLGRAAVADSIIRWGGWFFALGTLALAALKLLGGGTP